MARKTYRISATFPDLPSAHAEQEARGEGGSVRVAVNAALAEIFARPHVKGKRIRQLRLRAVQIGEAPGGSRGSVVMAAEERGKNDR